MKNKFKVGDRVESIYEANNGLQGVVTKIGETCCKVTFDNGKECWKFIESIKLIPTMKNIKDLGEKVAIQCKTQEEWDYIVKTYNLRCVRNNPDINIHFIDPTDGIFTLGFVKDNNYTIHQASDFMPLSPQDEIKELKERIATLEELYRPKKKIEFVKYLDTSFMRLETPSHAPKDFKNIVLLHKGLGNELDLIKAWDNCEPNAMIYLGHFNDGEK